MAATVRRQRPRRLLCWTLVAILLADLLALSDTLAVMSVDLGSESMKVAIVKPGVPMEIVLNKESRRKTPVTVTLKENERFLGDSAAGMAIKNPKATLRYFQHLLGKQADNPHVALYRDRFPEHELNIDPQRQTVRFQISPQLQFSPEEVLGMVLNYSRSLAEDFAVLQLINDNTATALSYGVFRRKDINSTAQVKPFVVRDAVIYPILVEFTREVEEEPGVRSLKHNKRVLFSRMGPYPQRKVITFNRYSHDFNFHINYGDLGFLGPEDLRVFGSQNLTTVKLKGVGESFKKYPDYESKGIKAHFNLDESGVLSLDRVESVFETLVEDSPEEESTLTKLGNTISSLFGGGTSSDAKENGTDAVQEEEESPTEGSKDEPGEQGDLKEETEAPVEDTSQPPPPEPKGDAAPEGEKPDEKESGGKSEAQKPEEKGQSGPEGVPPAPEEEKKQKPARKQKMVEEIGVELAVLDLPDLPEDELAHSVKKLEDLTLRDLEKQEREKAANSLEAFIFETQDKLYQPEYQEVSTEEQREEISGKLSATSTWLEDEGFGATTVMLKEKLAELKKLCQGLFFRVEERRKWPERLSALDNLLNHSSIFLKGARLIPEMDQIFTEVEMTTLEKVINDTWAWKNATLAEQAKLPATEKPVLLSKDIEAKMMALDREVQYLLNKAKFTKPRPRPKDKNGTRTEPPLNATAGDQEEKVIPPAGQPEEAKPILEPDKEETKSEPKEQTAGQKRSSKNDEL
ncbi:hypoxia up-regulated protein 1 precursor [Cricetulus griseus]|uniref:Hypoxia up-regulated protein 1 n=1 Tax=Cricetulus griseus TaxID=10029 RepID=A0A061I657_CRIGR|nr:hypoxia up-regulated protein 1 precursor [Cricetulus griseus]